jgi:hypothetical protein
MGCFIEIYHINNLLSKNRRVKEVLKDASGAKVGIDTSDRVFTI